MDALVKSRKGWRSMLMRPRLRLPGRQHALTTAAAATQAFDESRYRRVRLDREVRKRFARQHTDMSTGEAFDRHIWLNARAHNLVAFFRCHQILPARDVRLAADFASLRRDADFAAGRFSAAMLRRSASIKLTTFSVDGLTEGG